MDHSVMQGVEVVNSWLLGEEEVTWKDFSGSKSNVVPLHTNGAVLHAVSGKGLVEARRYPLTQVAAQAAVHRPVPKMQAGPQASG
jgi:hypothetical protein